MSFSPQWLGSGDTVKHELKKNRHAYVQVARGSVKLMGTKLEVGDGAASPLKNPWSSPAWKMPKCCFSTWRKR